MTTVLINPNSTASMTEAILAGAQRAAPGRLFVAWTNHQAPAAIQGPADGARAIPYLLDLAVQADCLNARAIVIACSDDTGLFEARRICNAPVVGIGQAAYHFAAMRWGRFSVVTTLPVSIPVIEEGIRAAGLLPLMGRVRASGVAVLDLDRDPGALEAVSAEIERAAEEDEVDCVVLGCAGMTAIAEDLRVTSSVPLVDGVEAAARLSGALAVTRRPE